MQESPSTLLTSREAAEVDTAAAAAGGALAARRPRCRLAMGEGRPGEGRPGPVPPMLGRAGEGVGEAMAGRGSLSRVRPCVERGGGKRKGAVGGA